MTSISGTISAGRGGAALILALSLLGGSAAFAQETPSTAATSKDAPWTSPGLHQPGPDQPQPGEPQPVPPTGPPIVDPTRPEVSAPASGDSLSERLARSDGVLVPTNPADGDGQGMQRTPPDPGPNTMPVLPPPDRSGDDRSVAPNPGQPK